MQRRIEALLFDLGRVVIDLDQARAHARWAELARVPMRDIAALVREKSSPRRSIAGTSAARYPTPNSLPTSAGSSSSP